MKVSTRGRYALRLMIDLAEHNTGDFVALKDISARQAISIKYLEQIVTLLCKAGFLKSVRGPQGGYKLTKDPKQYTVGSVLRITEGSLSPIACLEDVPNQCARCNGCSTVEFWQGLYQTINDYVDKITIEDLINRQKNKAQNNFII
jgi:Rrf2 family protein